MGTISSFLPARDPNELALVLSFQSAQALGRAVAILLEDDPATRLMSRPGASDGKFHLLMLR